MFPILQFLKGLFQGPTKEELKEFKEKVEKGNFGKISFPILIDEDGGLTLVLNWDAFMKDPDLCFYPFSPRFRLIDSRGALWTWVYDDELKLNVPGNYIRWVALNELMSKFKRHFKNLPPDSEVFHVITEATDIKSLFHTLGPHL